MSPTVSSASTVDSCPEETCGASRATGARSGSDRPSASVQRLEEDVDETVDVADIGRRRVDDANLAGRSGRRDDPPADDDRVLEMGANQICPASKPSTKSDRRARRVSVESNGKRVAGGGGAGSDDALGTGVGGIGYAAAVPTPSITNADECGSGCARAARSA